MRDGAVAGQVETAATSKEELAALMVGREVMLRVEKGPPAPGAAVLEVNALTLRDPSGQALVEDASFRIRAGEIVGIAGISRQRSIGADRDPGRAATAERRQHPLAWTADRNAGTNREIARSRRALGVTHVPEDRLRMGVVVDFDASETAILGYHDDPAYNGRMLSDRQGIIDHCARLMGAFDVRPAAPLWPTGAFSGGNQQKLVLAREIERDPGLLLVGQPTRGVDIGAIEFIHRRLVALRDAGKAILLVSAELEEILSLADRILVMFQGRIAGEMDAAEADVQKIGLLMAGADA